MRDVLNRLRDITRTLFLEHTHAWLIDPMLLRHDWKYAVLTSTQKETIQSHARVPLSEDQLMRIEYWMQQQELALKMFTSCGWFFDSNHGIETQQILAYAKALIEHTHQYVDWPFEASIQFELKALLSDRDVELSNL